MRDDNTEILLLPGLLYAAESNSSIGRNVHYFKLSIMVFLLTASTSTSLYRAVENRESCLVTCPNQTNFRRLTVASMGFCRHQVLQLCSGRTRWYCAPYRRCVEVFGDIYVQIFESCVLCSREASLSRSRREGCRLRTICKACNLLELLVYNLLSLAIAAVAMEI
ncbi:hypothetical protein DPMN_102560 [Dreissena polymorpha]|uniref:Uncharacterized protein n=1 Tax=Dreissena polymorpha TaxID=45954 RepID=A0A9D4LLK2_DREPO|nr:hypothetical protein DPMN_102560 [Dreissena polymorpha]